MSSWKRRETEGEEEEEEEEEDDDDDDEGAGVSDSNKYVTDVSHHQQQRHEKQRMKRNNSSSMIFPRAVSRLLIRGKRKKGNVVNDSNDTVADCNKDDYTDDDAQFENKKVENAPTPPNGDTMIARNYNSSVTALLATVANDDVAENNDHHHHNDSRPHGNYYTEDEHHHPRNHDIACHNLQSVEYCVGSKFVEVKLLLLDHEDQVKDEDDDDISISSSSSSNNKKVLEIPGATVARDSDEVKGVVGDDHKFSIKEISNSPPRITRRSAAAVNGEGMNNDRGLNSGCDYNDLILCGSSFPDDICALLSSHSPCVPSHTARRANNSTDTNVKDRVETMENGTASDKDNDTDALEEEEEEEDEQLQQIHESDHHHHTNTTKRARVDATSMPEKNDGGIRMSDRTNHNHTCHRNTILSMDQGKDTLYPDQEEDNNLLNTRANREEGSAVAAATWRTREKDGRPPMYARSMSATTSTASANISNLGVHLRSRGIDPGTMIFPPCGRPPGMPPPHQLLQRGRSLQLFPHNLDGTSSSAIPLAFSLSLQRQQSSRREMEQEKDLTVVSGEKELNVVSSSSSDANLSTKDNDDVVEIGSGTIVGGNTATLPIASLTSFYREQYLSLCEEGTFHIRFLDTYQGRNPNSTNGCTVIAPLMCVQYFTSSPSGGGAQQHEYNDALQYPWINGISDELINHVIDDQAAAILSEVRSKFNLERDAFIIPSDVHDHFINEGLLSTTQFVGVCGGNILDDLHIQALKSALLVSFYDFGGEWKNRKIAATLFFHGHVVALHVVANTDGGDNGWGNVEHVSIELIDSLPDPETWLNRTNRRLLSMSSDSSLNRNNSERDSLSQWRNEETDDGEWERLLEYNDDGDAYDELPKNAVRVRCTDVDHFNTLIRHYACSKFTVEEQQFCDRTIWEDSSGYCEYSYDPRVFQAFIWAEAK